MTSACADLEFRRASEVAQNDMWRADLVSLLVAAAQPYAQALYGEGPASAAIFSALMSRSSSELSADRVQVLFEATALCGCYVALPGAELPTCRRMELLESLRYFGPGGAASLSARLTLLGPLFPPVAEDVFYLGKLAVRPDMRGRGRGRLLLDHYLARGRQLGFHRFRLDLSSDNSAARRLYEAAGFRVVEQRYSAPSGLGYLAMMAER